MQLAAQAKYGDIMHANYGKDRKMKEFTKSSLPAFSSLSFGVSWVLWWQFSYFLLWDSVH